MKKYIFLLLLLIPIQLLAISYTWTGAFNTNWNNFFNWSPNGVPTVGDDVLINNGALLNQPNLDLSRTVYSLTMSAGTFNLGNFTLNASGFMIITGGSLQNGTITSIDFNEITNSNFTNIRISKYFGGPDNYWSGNNNFNKLRIINSGNETIETGSVNVTDSANLIISNLAQIRVGDAFTSSTFGNGIIIRNNGSSSGGITIGLGAPINITGGVISSNGGTFTTSYLSFENVIQTVFGGLVTALVDDFSAEGSTLKCQFSIQATFVLYIGNSVLSNSNILVKNSGIDDNWIGGNTFGTLQLFNNADARIVTLDLDVIGNTVLGISNSGEIIIGDNVTSSNFGDGISVNSFGVCLGGIQLGTGAPINIIGGVLTSSSSTFAAIYLTFELVFQNIFGGLITTQVEEFSVNGSELKCQLVVQSNYVLFIGNSFLTNSNILVKNGGIAETWFGPNTFGSLQLFNNSGEQIITESMEVTGASVFGISNDGEIIIGHNAITSTFGNGISFNSFGVCTGGIQLGIGAPIEINGGVLSSSSSTFSASYLYFDQVFQIINGGLITAQVDEFSVEDSELRCQFVVQSNLLLYVGNSLLDNSNILVKEGGLEDNWFGNNNFGSLQLINNSDAPITTEDMNVTGNAIFSIANAAEILIGDDISDSNFGNGITILSFGLANGGIRFGREANINIIAGTLSSSTTTFEAGYLEFNNVIQSDTSGSINAILSNYFDVDSSILNCDLDIYAEYDMMIENSTLSQTNVFTLWDGSGNYWYGNNKFGPLTITSNSSTDLQLATNMADTFYQDVIFRQLSAGDISVAFEGDNVFYGNITTVAWATPIIFGSSTGNVIMKGSGPQFITDSTSISPEIYQLTIDNPSDVTINCPILIWDNLNMLNGLLNTTAVNIISIMDDGNANGSSTSFVNGPLRKYGDEYFTFPIGSNNLYAPISISQPQDAMVSFTAQYFNVNPDMAGLTRTSKDVSLDHISACEYWTLDREAGFIDSVYVALEWDARSCGIDDMNDLRVARWNGSQWKDHGNSATFGTNAAGGLSTLWAVTDFSPFTLASVSTLNDLPVDLISFSATQYEKNNLVEWTTLTETNSDLFIVEKSNDAINFFPLIEKDGAGNSNSEIKYEIKDENPFQKTFYRLKQVDFNGDFSYSQTVFVHRNLSTENISLYPNPSNNGNFNLEINFEKIPDNVTISIFDISGKEILNYKTNNIEQKHFNITSSEFNSTFAPGIYFIQVKTDSNQEFSIQKLVIN